MSFDFQAARTMMVEGQIRPNRVTNPILLDQLEALPREAFVADAQRTMAYREGEVEVSRGRYLLAPMVFARMIEALELTPQDKVLDLACGNGYSTAVLSALAGHVVGMESDTRLANAAVTHLDHLGITNTKIQHGPLSLGAAAEAPYTAIFINGGIIDVPPALFTQLAEGGRLIAVVCSGREGQLGQVTLFEKFHNTVSSRVLFEAAATVLPGFTPAEGFSF